MPGEIRFQRKRNFTAVPNGIVRDTRLSLKALGLFTKMYSLPDDWDYSVAGLAFISGVGRDAIRSALAEMEKAGYLTRERTHGEGGKFGGNIYVVHEESISPLPEKPTMVAETADNAPSPEKPTLVLPALENPTPENPTQLKKDIPNKDLIKTPYSPPEGASAPDPKKKRRRAPKSVPVWQTERFEKFWDFYPQHDDRLNAVAEWDRLRPSDELIDIMARSLARQKASERWRKGIGIPYACRWIKYRRWEDEGLQLPSSDTDGGSPRVIETGQVPTW